MRSLREDDERLLKMFALGGLFALVGIPLVALATRVFFSPPPAVCGLPTVAAMTLGALIGLFSAGLVGVLIGRNV